MDENSEINFEVKEHKENSEHHEHKDDHEHKHLEHHKKQLNLWRIITAALAALLIIALFVGFGLRTSKANLLTKEKAAEKAMEYINNNLVQTGMSAKLVSIEEKGSLLYSIKIDISGREYESYITKDGTYLFPSGIDMAKEVPEQTPSNADPQPANAPKSNKPSVELFVMSHCPFGTQIEKGILPVANLLKDKIDFNVRFVYYAMHGKQELDEQMRQYCIQTEQRDKFTSYLLCFLKEGKPDGCAEEVKLDKEKLKTCIEATDKKFKITEGYNDKSTWLNDRFPLCDIDKGLNEKYSIGGSPTLVINGATVSSGRDSASLLKAVCSSFNEEPEECKKELSSTAPSPGFGLEEAGNGANEAAATASCG